MSHLGRATIALYNSYDPKSFREAHRRALARAGPLALAFDLNLATFGFPFPKELGTPMEISDWVSTTTSIGNEGEYLKELTSKGRFQVFDYPGKGFPPQLGEAILTTRKPFADRKITVDRVSETLLEGRSVLLVFGLGPRGAPKEVFRMCPRHLDITTRGLSLETCTAMGAVSAAIAHDVRRKT